MAQTAEFHGDLVTSHRNIYTPSSFARECLLHLQEAGSLRAAKPHTSKRSGLSSYLFSWLSPEAVACPYPGMIMFCARAIVFSWTV